MDQSQPPLPRPLAFSYIRFSSEQQCLGDSLRRQLALAEEYASRHEMTLDSHSYRDLGISAFKGRNAVEGKLATFLRGVDAGLIPSGSFLLVESLDRLSRNDVDDALELFLSIVRRGVVIVTLTDQQTYSKESIKRDRGISLIISITIMMRAHEESAIKSDRCKAAWKARVERGGILTSLCPSWLYLDDGKWLIREQKADVVRRIYKLYLEGKGAATIQRVLNDEAVPVMHCARFWTPGVVTRILNNRAVYGTLRREKSGHQEIPDYYPPILPRDTFERCRVIAKSRGWTSSPREPRPPNLFVGIGYCGSCGSRYRQLSGTTGHDYLQCTRAYSHAGCEAARVPTAAAEKALIGDLMSTNGIQGETPSESISTSRAIAALEHAQSVAIEKRKRLIKTALASKAIEPIALRIAEVERELALIRTQIGAQRRPAIPTGPNDLEEGRFVCGALLRALSDSSDRAHLRQRLKLLTRRIFARVEFDPLLPSLTLTYESGRVVVVPYEKPLWGFQPTNTHASLRKDRQATRQPG